MDGVHDMGGMHGFGRATWPGAERVFAEAWEPRAFALSTTTDVEGLRRNNGRADREELPAARYLAMSYYERWLASTERGLLEAGTIRPGEVEAMMDRLAAGEPAPNRRDPAQAARVVGRLTSLRPLPAASTARFAPGERVRVRRMRPGGHTRCPRYVRGATGVVERVQCADRLPDPGGHPVEPVYAVRFASTDLFGGGPEPAHAVLLDLWESYLEAAGA